MTDYTDSASSTFSSSSSHQWWRWPLMPIAAITGAVVATTVVSILQWLGMKLSGGFHEDGWYYIYVLPLITWGFFGYFFSLISYHVAPAGKLIAGAVMITILCICVLAIVIFVYFQGTSTAGERIQVTLSLAAIIVGCVAGLVQAQE